MTKEEIEKKMKSLRYDQDVSFTIWSKGQVIDFGIEPLTRVIMLLFKYESKMGGKYDAVSVELEIFK